MAVRYLVGRAKLRECFFIDRTFNFGNAACVSRLRLYTTSCSVLTRNFRAGKTHVLLASAHLVKITINNL